MVEQSALSYMSVENTDALERGKHVLMCTWVLNKSPDRNDRRDCSSSHWQKWQEGLLLKSPDRNDCKVDKANHTIAIDLISAILNSSPPLFIRMIHTPPARPPTRECVDETGIISSGLFTQTVSFLSFFLLWAFLASVVFCCCCRCDLVTEQISRPGR